METEIEYQYHLIWRNPFTDYIIKDEWAAGNLNEIVQDAKADTSLIQTDGCIIEFWKLEKQISLQRI